VLTLLLISAVALVFVYPLLATLFREIFLPDPTNKRREPTTSWSWKPRDLLRPEQWTSDPASGRWKRSLIISVTLLALVAFSLLYRRW